jgi:hypothetical protein
MRDGVKGERAPRQHTVDGILQLQDITDIRKSNGKERYIIINIMERDETH